MKKSQLFDILNSNGYTFAVIKDGKIIAHSTESGLMPLYKLFRNTPELLKHAIIVDKVTGKAAASLSITAQVDQVYSEIISEHALDLFSKTNISVEYLKKVPYIINRTKTDMCPMEKLVIDSVTVEDSVNKIAEFLKEKM